jgi:hypothetical protein
MLKLSVEYDYSDNFRTNALLSSGGRNDGSWAVEDEVLHIRYVLVSEVFTYLALLVYEGEVLLIRRLCLSCDTFLKASYTSSLMPHTLVA